MKLSGLFGIVCGTALFATSAAFALPKATEIYPNMGLGWNLGNTMEVPSDPTAWGNIVPTAEIINGVKAAGFTTIRIPCAWDSHASNGVINESWMDSVQTVVDMCMRAGLVTVLKTLPASLPTMTTVWPSLVLTRSISRIIGVSPRLRIWPSRTLTTRHLLM